MTMVFRIGIAQIYPALGNVERNFAHIKECIDRAKEKIGEQQHMGEHEFNLCQDVEPVYLFYK